MRLPNCRQRMRPQIIQRSANKLFGSEPHIPFPLWIPAVTQPEWTLPPIIPVVPADAPAGRP